MEREEARTSKSTLKKTGSSFAKFAQFFFGVQGKYAEKPVFFYGKPCIAIVAFRSMCSIYVAGTKERSRQNLASQMEGLS